MPTSQLPHRSWHRLGATALPWLLQLLILGAWEYAARSGLLSTRVLPEPWAVVKAAWHLVQTGEMWANLKVSAGRAFAGLAIGGGLGLLLGLLTGLFVPAQVALDTTLQMLRNIPPLAMIPLVILWFGIDEGA
ncbi:MAG: transporter permease, partial [Nevskia sp.]|nr:transporter permease [Nevskia sp.]